MAYQSDPAAEAWKNKSIVAQTSAKIAGELVVSEMESLGSDRGDWSPETSFTEWQDLIYRSTLELVGEPPTVAAPSGNGSRSSAGHRPQAGGGGSPRGDGELPYGKTVIKFGKHKGSTIADIDAADDADYLVWIRDSTDNDFLKKACGEYLSAKNRQTGSTINDEPF